MKEFFHGWRRKAGVVTLVMACAIAGAWMRSLSVFDVIAYTVNQTEHQIASADGTVYWGAWGKKDPKGSPQRPNGWIQLEPSKHPNPAKFKFIQLYLFRNFHWSVPFWSLTLPLTLLSAYLILWKPRKRPSSNSLVSGRDNEKHRADR